MQILNPTQKLDRAVDEYSALLAAKFRETLVAVLRAEKLNAILKQPGKV